MEESTPARQELYQKAVEAKEAELAQEQQQQQQDNSGGYGWPFWY